MTADASGVLLTEIVNHHNGVVIGTHGAVLFGIVAIVSLAVLLYVKTHSLKNHSWNWDWRETVECVSSIALCIALCVTIACALGAVTGSYELSEAIRVYESVYGPLPEGLFD